MRTTFLVLALVLPGCLWIPKGDTGEPSEAVDVDGDGYTTLEDCDDSDATVHPDADEICNGIDDDCDEEIDEDDAVDASTWYADADGDGFGVDEYTQQACEAPEGHVDTAGDCNDSDSDINPNATEVCDGADNDCDDEVDEDDAEDASTWYQDEDGDGYGSDDETTTACEQPTGYVSEGGDCDDSDTAFHPGAEEDDCADPNDYNCDGSTGYVDGDGDGWAACEECDDSDGDINPDATEICDDVDNDCDGDIDDDDASLDTTTASTWYADGDADGYGDASSTSLACDQPSGTVSDSTDCDDGDSAVNPAATEVCNGTDDDCDGLIDDEDDSLDTSTASTWYSDGDADGYGDASSTSLACDQPSGTVGDNTDCDDGDSAISPAATEVCNDTDDDCDGDIDDDDASLDTTTTSTWYSDGDADGYGDASSTSLACDQPSGTVADNTDCDDGDSAISPAATETCDEVDNDCDGDIDDDDSSLDTSTASTWYSDGDADGYGDASSTSLACDQPSGTVADSSDCDDGDASTHPGADEYCDGTDNDCDGATDEDESVDASTWYADSDSDGYGDASSSDLACYAPTSHVSDATDCDDSDSAVNPAATEICNGTDDDCDGDIDDDDSGLDTSTASTWYADSDSDGYGDSSLTSLACDQPSGTAADSTDCDDGDSTINPAATEICDDIDNDCDGDIDDEDASLDTSTASTWYTDADADGYGDGTSSSLACDAPSGAVSDSTDCDDGDGAVNPAASEICDEIDNDCDGDIDDDDGSLDTSTASRWYTDADIDGYGDSSSSTTACDQPSGTVADDTDCDDSDAGINPSIPEVYENGVDEDCDGYASIFWDDFDDETDGDSASGDDGWISGYGGLTWASGIAAYYTSDHAYSSSLSMSTAGGSGEAGRYHSAFGDDFAMSFQLYDEGNSNPGPTPPAGSGDLIVGFGSTSTPSGAYGVSNVWVGWNAYWSSGGGWSTYNCDDDYFCAADSNGHICNLAPRGVGWHHFELEFRYSASGEGHFVACVDDVCSDELEDCATFSGRFDESLDFFSINDDVFVGYFDDVHAWDLDDAPHLVLAEANVDAMLVGPNANERVGMSLDSLGDLDGDGYGDVIVGGSYDGGSDGTAYVMYGPMSGYVDLSGADAILEGTGRSSQFISNAGDTDGDGVNDVLISCYSGGGISYLMSGPFSGTTDITSSYSAMLEGPSPYWTTSSSGPGDLDGDGYDDMLFSGWNAYLVMGPASGTYALSSDADATFYSDTSEYLSATSSVGDIDGDGFNDILVGGVTASATESAAYLVLDPGSYTGSVVISSVATASYIADGNDSVPGGSLSGGGDVDGDGYPDWLIGAVGDSDAGTDAGAAYLVLGSGSPSGAIDLDSADAKLIGEGEDFEAGVSVSLDGDTNGDGLADILVGSSEDASTRPGRAYLFVDAPSGAVNLATADMIMSGELTGDCAGEMVKIIQDTDGDGLDDILVGATYIDWGASNAGGAYLLLGTEL